MGLMGLMGFNEPQSRPGDEGYSRTWVSDAGSTIYAPGFHCDSLG